MFTHVSQNSSLNRNLINACVCISSQGTVLFVFIFRTPAVNLMLHMALKIPSGVPPPSVAWPRLLPPVGCHQTRNSPRVPLTYPSASTAHLVTIRSCSLVHIVHS